MQTELYNQDQLSGSGERAKKRLRSACSQSFHIHFFFNYLMDYYQNESIVEKQKEKLKKLMKENQTLERDVYKHFIIKDNITTMNM